MSNYYLDQDKNESDKEISQCRPFVRFFSRMIDLLLFGIFVGLIQVLFFPSGIFSDDRSFSIMFLIVWTAIEAQLLSSWGTTPGKWLFNTKVRDKDLNKLSFLSAMKRSLLVFVIGLGIGMFSLITMLIAYSNIDSKGRTSWDKQCNSVVIHEKVGVLQIVAIITIIVIFIVLIKL